MRRRDYEFARPDIRGSAEQRRVAAGKFAQKGRTWTHTDQRKKQRLFQQENAEPRRELPSCFPFRINSLTFNNQAVSVSSGAMEYRKLGKTGWNVSVVGYGAAPLGGVYGKLNEKEGIRSVHTAIDLGINFMRGGIRVTSIHYAIRGEVGPGAHLQVFGDPFDCDVVSRRKRPARATFQGSPLRILPRSSRLRRARLRGVDTDNHFGMLSTRLDVQSPARTPASAAL